MTENTEIAEFQTPTSTVRVIRPNIIENIIKDYANIDVKDVLEFKALNKELMGDKPYAVLVNSAITATITKEARELSASKDFVQNTVAKALLVSGMGHKIVAKFYLKINKPFIKTEIFTDREEAIKWLEKELKLKGV